VSAALSGSSLFISGVLGCSFVHSVYAGREGMITAARPVNTRVGEDDTRTVTA
jgi:hypothetical protein